MTTITKERIELFIKNPLENGLTRGEQMELARIALASLEREQIRHEHAKWSDSTFGCVGPIGPLKHLSKEALDQTILASGLICSFCCGMHSAVLASAMLKLPLLWKIN
jgi:hypothetical protein